MEVHAGNISRPYRIQVFADGLDVSNRAIAANDKEGWVEMVFGPFPHTKAHPFLWDERRTCSSGRRPASFMLFPRRLEILLYPWKRSASVPPYPPENPPPSYPGVVNTLNADGSVTSTWDVT